MKQIAIISGKGGAGKTSLTSAFGSLAKSVVFADCDVNASDLHIILNPEIEQAFDFENIKKVKIDQDECIRCGLCFNICHFNAIDRIRNQYYVREFSCAACDLCRKACPVSAIEQIEKKSGEYFISDTRFGPMVYGQLNVGEDYSSKLVAYIRDAALEILEQHKFEILLLDGPPGIGCEAISTILGTDLAVIIVNPTKSGLEYLKRSIELTDKHEIANAVIINKSDFNCDISDDIEAYCLNNNITVLGKVPYDRNFTYAMLEGKSIIEYSPESVTANMLRKIWSSIVDNVKAKE